MNILHKFLTGIAFISVFLSPQFSFAEDKPFKFPPASDGRRVLAFDFHTHSVFSDGSVWPTVRVEEAVMDGLAGYAVTEHFEYQPKQGDIPNPDRNRAYELASEAAPEGFLVINGVEITRGYPPGHVNAVFMKDVNALKLAGAGNSSRPEDLISRELIELANAQGAFVFWNHPNWLGQQITGMPDLTDMHKRFIKEGLIRGIELNGSEANFQIALDYGLTILANSDVHGKIEQRSAFFENRYDVTDPTGVYRRATLVLAAKNDGSSIKQALFDRATVAVEKKSIFGREAEVAAVVGGALSMELAGNVRHNTHITHTYRIRIHNAAPIAFILRNIGKHSFFFEQSLFTVPAHSTKTVLVTAVAKPSELTDLRFEIMNAYIGPRKNLVYKFKAAK